jgi:hypothetical protein
MTDRCPIEPGTRVRIVSGPFALYGEAIVARVQPAVPGWHGGAWRLTCTLPPDRNTLPLGIDEVQPIKEARHD